MKKPIITLIIIVIVLIQISHAYHHTGLFAPSTHSDDPSVTCDYSWC